MPGGAPEGNQNAAKGKRFQKAIERVLARKYGDVDKGYEALAEKYVEMVEEKEAMLVKDVADRTDGKPPQQINHAGHDGEALQVLFMQSDAEA